MYAIFETGGKQFKVQAGDEIVVEKLPVEAGESVMFDRVLLVEKDGSSVIGSPVVTGASVSAKVLEHGKDKKIIVFKYKSKKNYRRKQGHRQPFSRIVIEQING